MVVDHVGVILPGAVIKSVVLLHMVETAGVMVGRLLTVILLVFAQLPLVAVTTAVWLFAADEKVGVSVELADAVVGDIPPFVDPHVGVSGD